MPFGPAHLYLPLQDSNGKVYRNVTIWLMDPSDGSAYAAPVFLNKDLAVEASFPLTVTTGYVNLWTDTPDDVLVRVDFGPGEFSRYTSFIPSADEVARGEENLLVNPTSGDTGSVLTYGRDGEASFDEAASGRHSHAGQGESSTHLGPVLSNNFSFQKSATSPRSVTVGQGWGMAGEDGVMLGQGERSPDATIPFGEPSEEVTISDYGSITPQSVWVSWAYNWDLGAGRDNTSLLRHTTLSMTFLSNRHVAIGGAEAGSGTAGEGIVWVGSLSPGPDGTHDFVTWVQVSTAYADARGYEGSFNLGTEPEALLWSGRPNVDPVDAVAIGIDGAVSDFQGNFVDYGADGYSYDLGDEDPTVANPTPFHLRQAEVEVLGDLEVQGDAVIGNSELATATSALLGFFGTVYDVDLTDIGDLVELVGHPLVDEDPISFFNIATTTGIEEGTTYYVVNAGANNFQIEETIGGGAIPFGGYVFAVALTDSGDLVELAGHPYADEDPVVFSDIVTTTGVVNGTIYYVVNAGLDDFQVEATIGGGALALTGDGTANIHLVADGIANFQLPSTGAPRAPIATLPGDPPALLSLIAALTSYGMVISGETPILADSMNRADGLVGYAQTGQVRESVAVSSNPDWGIDVEIVTSVAKRSADYTASPVYSTYATPVSDVISEATIENWGTAVTDAGLFIRGIYNGADVVPIDGLLAAQDGLYQVEGGASLVLTPLDTWASLPDGVVLRIEADADAIEVFADNVSISTVTNSWCQTGKRHGYVLGAGDASISEFILYAL